MRNAYKRCAGGPRKNQNRPAGGTWKMRNAYKHLAGGSRKNLNRPAGGTRKRRNAYKHIACGSRKNQNRPAGGTQKRRNAYKHLAGESRKNPNRLAGGNRKRRNTYKVTDTLPEKEKNLKTPCRRNPENGKYQKLATALYVQQRRPQGQRFDPTSRTAYFENKKKTKF